MEALFEFIPGGITSAVLAIFALIRVGITIYEGAVAATPSKEDDLKWQAIKNTLWFAILEKTLYYLAGIQLPAKKE